MTTVQYTRRGGRSARYRHVQGEMIELFDPFEVRTLQFPSHSLRDLWLLKQSAPGFRRIEVHPPPLRAKGPLIRHLVCPDLTVTGIDGKPVHELLLSGFDEPSRGRVAAMLALEAEEGIRWRATRVAELLSHRTVLANMDAARRSLTIYLDHPFVPLTRWVMDMVARGQESAPAISLGSLRAALVLKFGADAHPPLKAVLFRLRRSEELSFDITQRINDETLIRFC